MRTGDQVPDFELPDQDGISRRLSTLLSGGPVVYPLLADVDGEVAALFGVKRGKIGERLGAPVKRWTFAIGRDRRVLAAIHSEVNMDTHADQALAALGSTR